MAELVQHDGFEVDLSRRHQAVRPEVPGDRRVAVESRADVRDACAEELRANVGPGDLVREWKRIERVGARRARVVGRRTRTRGTKKAGSSEIFELRINNDGNSRGDLRLPDIDRRLERRQ